jgi:hypothetical protein
MPTRQVRVSEAGAAAMMSIAIMAILFMLIVSGLLAVQLSKATIGRQLTYHGQAINAAQAGLVDSLSWFRRQPSQPVSTFVPVLDSSQSPPVNDTDDPAVGLVRDYEISDLGSVWGRYEVRLARVRDVSGARGQSASGSVWLVDSVGIVYVRTDKSKGHDQSPNRVLTRAYARTELRRLSLVLPANAAVCSARGDNVDTDAATRVLGGASGIGVAYPPSTGSPSLSGSVDGLMNTSVVDPYNDGIEEVFGVGQQELVGMADVVAASAADLPATLPVMSLIIVTGDAVFTSATPLVGSGLLVVLGDLQMQSGSLSSFNGLIYTTGDYDQGSPSQVSGAVVSRGQINLRSSGDFSEVYYDPAILSQIMLHIGQYRFSRSPTLLSG